MTHDEIIEMARQALKQEPREDWNSTAWVFADETLEAFAKLVAEKEREACAKILDANAMACNTPIMRSLLQANATAIRARGNT